MAGKEAGISVPNSNSSPSPLGQGNRVWAGRAVLPLPACHQGVYARLRRAMERVGGRFHKLKLATQSL
jgi:hypothetical protein